MISEMNIQEQSLQMEDGVEKPEVAMNLTLSAYGRQPKAFLQPKESDN